MPPSRPDRALSPEPSRPADASPSERRRTPRAKPAGLTYVKLEPDNGGRLLDVCESGIGFQVVAPVEDTRKIQLWFVLDSESHIEVSGELAWIDDSRRSGGLKFTKPSKQARQQLRAWLSHHHPEATKEDLISPAPSVPSSTPAHAASTAPSQPLPDYLSHESEFERHLHNLPHTDPAPLESLLDTILNSIQTSAPEDLFARPALPSEEVPAQSPANEIEASGLVEKLALEHSTAMTSAALPAPTRAPAQLAAHVTSPSPAPRIRRNAPVRSAPAAQASGLATRETPSNPAASARAGKPADIKYVQFRMAVDRVSGMLTTLRHAIAADDSDWPLTATPEYHPLLVAPPAEAPAMPPIETSAIAPSVAPVIKPPVVQAVAARIAAPVASSIAPPVVPPVVAPAVAAVVPPTAAPVRSAAVQPAAVAKASPAQKIAKSDPAPPIKPEPKAEMDVRPWSAGAPWRAAEPPAPSLATRFNQSANVALGVVAKQILRASSACAAVFTAAARTARSTVVGFSASTATFLRAAKLNIAPMLSRTGSAALTAATNVMRGTRAAAVAAFSKLKPAARVPAAAKTIPIAAPPRATLSLALTNPVPAKPAITPSRPAIVLRAWREKLAAASTGIKRASSNFLFTAVPAEPTRGEIGALALVAVLLISGLLAFNYRGKLDLLPNPFAASANSDLVQPDPTPEAPAPAHKKSSGRVVRARRSASAPAATAQIGAIQPEPQAMPSPSTREMATALAYLNGRRGQRDPVTAAQWLWAASRKGDTGANLVLADLYLRGDGVPQNCRQAQVLLLAASKKGNEQATQKLQQADLTSCGGTQP